MRFALRNKKKIIDAFDETYHNRMVASLKAHFIQNETIEEHKNDQDKYAITIVSDLENTDGMFIFYVIRKTYDVYLLAYKTFVS